MVGDVGVGGTHPIRVQSMTISDTMDTEATVAEVVRLVDVGCEIVRITAPSMREAENLKNIKAGLDRQGVSVPLVADIHFTPNAALVAAEYVEKVRINPGNYADKKRFEQREYTDAEYERELDRIAEKFAPLVLKCQRLGRAMRIGTNHGSLSDRIMNRHGDTAAGMVESALEFVNICRKHDYHDIILSMKSSNPLVAIQAYRLLAARMDELNMDYPFHLGVTEAGDGEEGRIKSAVGIGGLLEDGIGDTIRVSLTEDAVAEVPVAFDLVKKYNELAGLLAGRQLSKRLVLPVPNPFEYRRRETLPFHQIYHEAGSGYVPRVELSLKSGLSDPLQAADEVAEMLGQSGGALPLVNGNGREVLRCETVHLSLPSADQIGGLKRLRQLTQGRGHFIPFAVDITDIISHLAEVAHSSDRFVYRLARDTSRVGLRTVLRQAQKYGKPLQLTLSSDSHADSLPSNHEVWLAALQGLLEEFESIDYWNVIFACRAVSDGFSIVHNYRYLSGQLAALEANFPILLQIATAADDDFSNLQAAAQLGSLLCDGIGDAIHLTMPLPVAQQLQLAYNLLQATRLRISKADYISCPSCGRTLFDLQTTTERIKSKTDHLKGIKIAIMGCIVNGPGEMADADFGYVGAGPQKVNLFVGKDCVERNIPEAVADQRLIELIKAHGRWSEPH